MFLQCISCLILLLLCLSSTGCGGVWSYLWDRSADTDVDSDLLIIPGSGGPEDTMVIFEGAVNYTGEVHSGTDIYYIGTGARRNRIIVIDAGHQAEGNSLTEPNGPGASVMTEKVAWGGTGAHSGSAEHQLNLEVALLLRDELIQRGYSVVMIRETSGVNISNMERAQIANKYSASAFVSIHANADEDSSLKGAMAICQSQDNPYPDCAAMYQDSRLLAEEILSAYCLSASMRDLSVWEMDDRTNINWSRVPTAVLEMGYLTNESDDMLMAIDFFKQRAAAGIADGIDAYMDVVELREESTEDGTQTSEEEATATVDVGSLPESDTYSEEADNVTEVVTESATHPEGNHETEGISDPADTLGGEETIDTVEETQTEEDTSNAEVTLGQDNVAPPEETLPVVMSPMPPVLPDEEMSGDVTQGDPEWEISPEETAPHSPA